MASDSPHLSRRAACRIIASVVPLALLDGCGGGSESSSSTAAQLAKAIASEDRTPGFAAEPAVAVDSTATSQRLAALDPLAHGGYGLAWSAGAAGATSTTLRVQRFSSDGTATGSLQDLSNLSDVHVLVKDEELVNASVVWRNPELPGAPYLNALLMQRYALDGSAIGPAVTVASRLVSDPSIHTSSYADPFFAGWSDGGFVLGWSLLIFGGGGGPPRFFARRFDADGQPASDEFSEVGDWGGRFALTTFSDGGWLTIVTQRSAASGDAYANIRQFDTRHPLSLPPAETLPPPPATSVLDLGTRGRVLFSGQQGPGVDEMISPYSQWFNPSGRTAGPDVPLPATPTRAVALADGSYVTFWPGSSPASTEAQLYDTYGHAQGGAFTIDAPADALVAPHNAGFVLAWTTADAQPRVMLQRFVKANR